MPVMVKIFVPVAKPNGIILSNHVSRCVPCLHVMCCTCLVKFQNGCKQTFDTEVEEDVTSSFCMCSLSRKIEWVLFETLTLTLTLTLTPIYVTARAPVRALG